MKWREWPLVVFTLFGQTAAGLALFLILPLYLFPALSTSRSLEGLRLASALLVAGVLGASALVSLFHLGRPRRAMRALANAGSSWLSKEILAEGIFGGGTAVLAVLAWKAPASPVGVTLAVLVVAEAVALVYSMARIYMISAVPAWFSAATPISFFASALVLGSQGAAILAGGSAFRRPAGRLGFAAGLRTAALATLAAAFLAALFYAPRFGVLSKRRSIPAFPARKSLPLIHIVRLALLAAALGFLTAAVLADEIGGPLSILAITAAFLSESLGRFLFYSLPDGL